MTTTEDLPTLYHVPKTISSPIVQVLLDLDLAGGAVRIETLGFADLKSPEHLARNPMGTSPTFVDARNGISIWESGAVLTYLLETYDVPAYALHPNPATAPPKERADFWHLQQFVLATVYPFVASLSVHVLLKPTEEQDAGYVASARDTFRTRMGPVLADALGGSKFFLGRTDRPSAIDYLVAKPLSNADAMGLLDTFPTLRAHFQTMRCLPSFAKAYYVDRLDDCDRRLLKLVPSSAK